MPLFHDDVNKQEKIDGIVYNMSPSGDYRHGTVNINIVSSISPALKESICRVYVENLDWKYSATEDNYVIPDVMIICDPKNIKKNQYTGVSKFIVETISPSSVQRDRKIKKGIYERTGVEEYWIIDPVSKSLEIYYLQEGKYDLYPIYWMMTRKARILMRI